MAIQGISKVCARRGGESAPTKPCAGEVTVGDVCNTHVETASSYPSSLLNTARRRRSLCGAPGPVHYCSARSRRSRRLLRRREAVVGIPPTPRCVAPPHRSINGRSTILSAFEPRTGPRLLPHQNADMSVPASIHVSTSSKQYRKNVPNTFFCLDLRDVNCPGRPIFVGDERLSAARQRLQEQSSGLGLPS